MRRILAAILSLGLVVGGAAPVLAAPTSSPADGTTFVSADGKGKAAGKKGKKKGKKGKKKGDKKKKKGDKKA